MRGHRRSADGRGSGHDGRKRLQGGFVRDKIEEKIIFVESQNFETNTITDINGKKYFVDWLSMKQYQHRNLTIEFRNMPIKFKKFFGVFCEKGLKIEFMEVFFNVISHK